MKSVENRGIVSDAIWTICIKIFSASSNLLIMTILARIVSQTNMGYFLIAQSLAIFFAMIARVGMKQPVVKLVGTYLENNQQNMIRPVLNSVTIIVLLGFSLVWLALNFGLSEWLFLEQFSADEVYHNINIWFIAVFCLAFQTPLSESFRGLHKIIQANLFDGPVTNAFFLGIITYLLLFNNDYDNKYVAIFSYLCLSYIFSLLIGIIILYNLIYNFKSNNSIYSLIQLLKLGLPVYSSNLMSYLVSQFGLYACGLFLHASDAAAYGAALRLMLAVTLPLFVLEVVMQSRIVKLHALGDKKVLEQHVRVATTFSTLASIIISVVVVLNADKILDVIYGKEYTGASVVLIVLTIGELVNVSVGPCLNFMLLVGRRGAASIMVMITGILSISASVYLVEDYGIVGIALANAGGLIFQNITIWIMAKKMCKVSTATYINPFEFAKILTSINKL